MKKTEAVERVSSVFVLFSMLTVSFLPGLAVLSLSVIFLFWGEGAVIGVVVGFLMMLAGIPAAMTLLWLSRRALMGSSAEVLQGVADQLALQASVGSLWTPMVRPRLKGALNGRAFDMSLLRVGGFLAPALPGNRFLIFGWIAAFDMDVSLPVRIGFAPGGSSTAGAGLLGLSGQKDLEGMRIWAGDSPEHMHIAMDKQVLVAAGRVLDSPLMANAMVRVGPRQMDIHMNLHHPISVDVLADWLSALEALASACEKAHQEGEASRDGAPASAPPSPPSSAEPASS